MVNNFKSFIAVLGLAVALGTYGCGQKRIESSAVPSTTGSEGMTSAPMAKTGRYVVEKHDCLWTIAALPKVYGDSFQWPELFKANRDQIQDPDLIYPRQMLKVQQGFSLEEVNHARQMASVTPKYAPHSKPRQALPVNYF